MKITRFNDLEMYGIRFNTAEAIQLTRYLNEYDQDYSIKEKLENMDNENRKKIIRLFLKRLRSLYNPYMEGEKEISLRTKILKILIKNV